MTDAQAPASGPLHGEYKVPGGKLVVVDLEVDAGRLANVQLAGDFFLEPDEALDDINRAVTGLAANASAADIAEAVRTGLREDAVLLGFSPEAVGIAIRRALTRATSFAEYEWAVIRDVPREPREQVALDETLTREVAEGRRGPTVRFWQQRGAGVYVGSFQSIRNEVDMEAAQRHGVQVVRRITGGGAMFSEADNVITYSLYAPTALVQGMSFADSYAFLDAWVLEGLQAVGINAVYKPLNDIASDAGKIGGAAQKRLGAGAVLHHVTMSYDIDAEKMVQVLRIGREKLSDKGTTSAKKRVDPLRSQTGMERDAIVDALAGTFQALYGGTADSVRDDELARARQLVAEKFATDEWLYRVP